MENASKNLTELNLIDKFEFVCSDIFDELHEKVDCIVASFMLNTCIQNYEMLSKFFSLCVTLLRDDGCLFVTEFCWVRVPKDGWYTAFGFKGTDSPKEFEVFDYFIDKAPDQAFKIHHIPSYLLFKAGCSAGFTHIEHSTQTPPTRTTKL